MATTATNEARPRKQSATEQLDDLITELSKRCRLDRWNDFVDDTPMPAEFMAALITGRPELIAIVQPRAMTAEEVGHLYKLIGVLLDTNMALQQHAQQVAHQVDLWHDAFKHLNSVGNRIQHFANFRRTDESDELDEG